jgi:hypothetical protein
MVKYFADKYKDELTQEMTLADVSKAQEMLSQCVKRNYTNG